MEEVKPVKGRKKLTSSDEFHVGLNKPVKKLVARKNIDKLMKKKARLPTVRSQSVSPTAAASTSGIKEPKNISKAGNKSDKVNRRKRNSLPMVRNHSVSPPVSGISRIKVPKKLKKTGGNTDKDVISKEKTAKSKDTGIVKPTKSTGTAKKTQNGGIAKKAKDTGIAKAKETGIAKKTEYTGTAKKTEDTGTAKKTEEDTEKLNMGKSVVGNQIQKREITVKKQRLIDDVFEAIVTNGQPKKGVSSQAIKSYIFSKRGVDDDDKIGVKRFNTLVNNAIKKGMEDGSLQRPTTSKGNGPAVVSALGRFTLSNKVVKPKNSKKLIAKKGSETVALKT